jgi:signal transduction histidine kinase/ligand-binding sensor domain-containing protein/CheY-like chemotaxis protein
LSQSTINSILQDKKGFMWFGTQEGLNRYDGHEFAIYKHSSAPHSLSSDNIYFLFEDRQGFLWVGTDNGGLNRFDPASEEFTSFKHEQGNPGSLSNDVVHAIYQDRQGVLWVGTEGGLDRYDADTKTFIHYRHIPGDSTGLSNNEVRCIIEDQEANLWIGTWGGGLNRLSRSPEGTETFSRFLAVPGHPNSLTDNQVGSIQLDSSGGLYIGTANGFTHFQPSTGIFTRYQRPPGTPNSLANNRINALYLDTTTTPGYLWICTDKGLHRFNCQTGEISGYRTSANTPKSVSRNWIVSFYRDRSGNYWIGTSADGIYRIDHSGYQFGSYLKNIDDPDSLVDSSVNAIYADRRGVIWIGTTAGLKSFDRAKNQISYYKSEVGNPNSLSYSDIRCILEDRQGIFWIGTYSGGLNRFDRAGGRFTRYLHDPGNPNSLCYNDLRCLYEDRRGLLWIGTNGGGLDSLDARRKRFTHYQNDPDDPGSLGNQNIRAIYEDHAGVLWIGTSHGGLDRFNRTGGQFSHYRHDPRNPDSLSHNFVLFITEDRQNALWIGTAGGGLNRLDPSRKHFSHFTVADGLPNNIIYGVLEDEAENLWISTNKGLSQFNPKTGQFTNYDWSDGLQSDEFNFAACCKSESGEMFFGGINGFNAFYPGAIKHNDYVPPVFITGFRLFNKPVPIGKGADGRTLLHKSIIVTDAIELTHNDYIFSFQFAALNYISPAKNQYAYIMEGFEGEWNHVGNRNFATYINLPPGEYRFRVRGSNNDGVWNKEGAFLKLIIHPPFWRTWWFRMVVIVSIFGLIFFIHRLRVRSLQRQQKKLEQMVVRRTRELEQQREIAENERASAQTANEAKSQFLARMSHEIRTPMNAVVGFTDMLLDTKLNHEQLDYARSIQQGSEALLTLINDILDFSKIEAGQLIFDSIDFNPEIIVSDICELIMPRIGTEPIDMFCRIGERVPDFVKGDPGRFRQVVLNLVGNAVKFTEAGEVEVSLEVEAEEQDRLKLHTLVRDTGIGIPRDKLPAIFAVFQQVDGSITRRFGGTGLGLAICKQIAQLMEGDVWVESELGKGSVFHFTAWVEKSTKQMPKPKLSPHLSGKRILVINGNCHNRDTFIRQLEQAGLEVVGPGKGEDVTAVLRKGYREGKPFHLCILDTRLAGERGDKLLTEIRGLEAPLANLPVLAISSANPGQLKGNQEAGFDECLAKPVTRQKFISLVDRLLGGTAGIATSIEETLADTRQPDAEKVKPKVKILLAEDNPINQKLIRYILTQGGYQLHVVNNGKEAVDAYIAAPDDYDLILMDVQMPVMDGKEATRIIRENQKDSKKIPIIAVTAEVMKGDKEKILAAGMDDYIPKPIKKDMVFRLVNKWAPFK